MALTSDEVRHVALLARLAMKPEDLELYRSQLDDILHYFQMLENIQTDGVVPTNQSVTNHTVMREDKVEPGLDKEDVLANAPRREGDYFRVKAVLE